HDALPIYPREAAEVQRAAVEQNFHHDVVVSLGYVVRRLLVVRVGAALEEETRQLGMTRDRRGPVDRALEDRSRVRMVDRLVPSRLRGCSGIEQDAGRADEGVRA